jgi:hemolysin activation/secretion protein
MKTTSILIVSLGLAALPALAQDFQQIAPKTPVKNGAIDNGDNSSSQTGSQLQQPTAQPTPPPAKKKDRGDSQLLPKLKGLVFVSSPADVRGKGVFGVVGVKADGIPLLQKEEFQTIVAKYLGQPLTLNDLNDLVHDVIIYYKNHDRPIVDVSVPEQDITSGDIQIVAVEGRLGKVRVEGNHWFSTSDLAGDIRLHPNDPISGRIVSSDATWLNANPFRQVDLVYAPGDKPGTTDIVLKTQDRFPLRVYTGYENTGNQYTGYNRWLAGFNWGNAFGLDQQINYQFTANNEYNLYNAQSGSWIIPLPWRHTLTFFGSYSQSRPDSGNPLFTQNGYSWQVSGRYTMPLPGTETFSHEFLLGFDFKRSNSDLFFGGAPVFATVVDVDQFMAGYNATLVDHYGSTTLNASFFFSPGGMSEYNHQSDFTASQAGSDPHYYYTNIQLNRITKLPWDFSLATKILGQVSSGTMIGSEQFGIGGYTTVRGYDERGVNGDSGIVVSNELRTPPVSIGQFFGIAGATDQLQFLGFVDYGAVTNNKVVTGPTSSDWLLGVGPGVRYLINPYFTVRADYGLQLKSTDIPGVTNHSYLELGAILSY